MKQRDESVFVRVSADERQLVEQAAATSGESIGVWVRHVALEAARRVVRQHARRDVAPELVRAAR